MKPRRIKPRTSTMKPPADLEAMLDYLHLPLAKETHRDLLAAAGKENLSHHDFLARLLSNEASAKFERQVRLRLAQARFPFVKTIEEFDWAYPTAIPKAKIL